MAVDALTLPHMAHGTAVVVAHLNVRADPHTGAAIRGLLVPGELVDVWAVQDGWAIVQNAHALTGWSATAYLEINGILVA